MNKIFYIMGKSGTGKDSMFNLFMNDIKTGMFLDYDCGNIKPLVMNTTRPKRDGEINGETYNFVTEEQMRKDIDDNKVVEMRSYNTIDGVWYYYTSTDNINLKECSYIATSGTPTSYEEMKKVYGDSMVPIMMLVEKDERFLRLVEREKRQKNPNYVELCRRFLSDEAVDSQYSTEEVKMHIYDEAIHDFLNDDIHKCHMLMFMFIVETLRS